MKGASTSLKAHLAGSCTTLARLYKITLKNGTVYAFTDHDQSIDTTGTQDAAGLTGISDGGHVYIAAAGFSPTAIENKADLSVDNQQATAFIDDESIKETDIRFGLWSDAAVEIRIVNWADLTDGELKMRKGSLGAFSLKNYVLTSDILGLTNKLTTLVGHAFGPSCDAELGDARCQATVPVETGTIASSADAHHVTPNAGLTGPAGYYDDGVFTITSGPNSGLSFQIGTWDGTVLSLKNPLLTLPIAGNTFSIKPGCSHDVDDCQNKFDNLVNHRGFPTMPTQDQILTYPDATS